ncbi:MAG: flagellar assembly peptidoglycan hydrolase FlgJ [Stenotrophomonas sp.]
MRPQAIALSTNNTTSSTPQRIEHAARQLESQFARMMIKSMRDASFGDSLFPGENQMFRDMYDERLAQTLTQGRGLGLQATIARQLGGQTAAAEAGDNPPLQPSSLQRQQALRAYQSQLPAATAGTAIDAQAALLAPLSMAIDAMDGRETASLHQRLDNPLAMAGNNPLDLLAAASGDWSRMDDRWRQPAGQVDQTDTIAAQRAASQFASNSPEAFVARIWPHARQAADALGVDPRALVAQAALETAWGKRLPNHADGSSGNNLFGIKATGWKGRAVTAGTHEYVAGIRRNENASFRAYDSIGESFNDYVRLLKNNDRYAGALAAGTDVAGFARGLQRGGYATDPQYANKIAAIADGSTVTRALAAIERAQVQLNPASSLAMNR